jgi:hypothetical protein
MKKLVISFALLLPAAVVAMPDMPSMRTGVGAGPGAGPIQRPSELKKRVNMVVEGIEDWRAAHPLKARVIGDRLSVLRDRFESLNPEQKMQLLGEIKQEVINTVTDPEKRDMIIREIKAVKAVLAPVGTILPGMTAEEE